MLAAEEIRRSNPNLYEAILPYIDQIPDFRPSRTANQMKKVECAIQYNWEMVYHELTALTYNESHMNLMNALNRGDISILILSYTRCTDSLAIFSFSYPALIWLMTKISPKETLYPFLVACGEYLHLVPMERKYVKYIQLLKTARWIRKHYPSLISKEEINLIMNDRHIEPFHLYWILAEEKMNLQRVTGIFMENIARTHDMGLIKEIIPPSTLIEGGSEAERTLIYFLEECIARNFFQGVEYILNIYRVHERMLLYYIKNSLYEKTETCTVLLRFLSRDILPEEIERFSIYIDKRTEEVLLRHPRTKAYKRRNKDAVISNNLWDCMMESILFCQKKLYGYFF